jgi:hypothetical protein
LKTSLIFLLVVGFLWSLFNSWLFLVLGGIAAPTSLLRLGLYWSGMFFGPGCLIVGSVLLLRSSGSRLGLVLVGIGCLVFTAFVLYNSVQGMQRAPLQAPPPYAFFGALLVLMVLSDLAAYKVWRVVGSRPTPRG